MSTAVVQNPAGWTLPEAQGRLLRWTIYIGYFALAAGVAHGLAQALSYARIDILQYFPALESYYQGLTAHGDANALFMTFAYSNGILPLLTARALGRPLNH
jgi:cytochrome c oxidase subunit 1